MWVTGALFKHGVTHVVYIGAWPDSIVGHPCLGKLPILATLSRTMALGSWRRTKWRTPLTFSELRLISLAFCARSKSVIVRSGL